MERYVLSLTMVSYLFTTIVEVTTSYFLLMLQTLSDMHVHFLAVLRAGLHMTSLMKMTTIQTCDILIFTQVSENERGKSGITISQLIFFHRSMKISSKLFPTSISPLKAIDEKVRDSYESKNHYFQITLQFEISLKSLLAIGMLYISARTCLLLSFTDENYVTL